VIRGPRGDREVSLLGFLHSFLVGLPALSHLLPISIIHPLKKRCRAEFLFSDLGLELTYMQHNFACLSPWRCVAPRGVPIGEVCDIHPPRLKNELLILKVSIRPSRMKVHRYSNRQLSAGKKKVNLSLLAAKQACNYLWKFSAM
jgi:hypothetical protein